MGKSPVFFLQITFKKIKVTFNLVVIFLPPLVFRRKHKNGGAERRRFLA